MSAAELRKAAETLRERAGGGHDAPWRAVREPSRSADYDVTCLVTSANESVFEDSYCSLGAATYIATMHPGVGLALADWLDAMSSGFAAQHLKGLAGCRECTMPVPNGNGRCPLCDAETLARLILGGAS